MTRDIDRFPPLKPGVFEILLALSEGELHGYAILKRLDTRDVQRHTILRARLQDSHTAVRDAVAYALEHL